MVLPVIRSTSAPLIADSGLTAGGAPVATPLGAPAAPVVDPAAPPARVGAIPGGAATAPGVFAPVEPLVPAPAAPLAWSSTGTGPPAIGVVRVRGTTTRPVAGQ